MRTADGLIRQALSSGDTEALRLAYRLASHPLYRFAPRPDRPAELDQQSSFFQDRFPGLACCLAGNGAGKSFVAAAKVATFLASTPPPEPNTPYWVLSTTLDLASANCWGQNLARFVRPEQIAGTVWYSATRGLPRSVILRPHQSGNNWVLEFKSYDMARERLQAANIAGAWLDEQAPYEVLMEVWARCRIWDFPGSKIYTLTPLQPDTRLEQFYREPPSSWKFYRMNTRLNTSLDPEFVRQIEQSELAELVETRLTGAFARYEGAVFPTFSVSQHVIAPIPLERTWLHVRGLDLGWSHATACVWAARTQTGRYYVYREYLQTKTSVEEHVKEIQSGWAEVFNKGHTYADPAAAQTLHEFALRGLPTVPATKDVKAGIATVQTLLRPQADGRPGLLIFDTCPHLIRQLRGYVWDDKKQDQPRKTEDDMCDAVRYMLHSHRQDAEVKTSPLTLPDRTRKLPC